MKLSLIAAISDNGIIGRRGELPWHIPADLKRFATLTRNHSVVMGRKTYESIFARIGKPLPDRTNIVITRQDRFDAPGCTVVHSLNEALRRSTGNEVFVIGGEEIYRQALPISDRLYITRVHVQVSDGDAYFPQLDEAVWNIIERTSSPPDSDISYEYVTYERKGDSRDHGKVE